MQSQAEVVSWQNRPLEELYLIEEDGWNCFKSSENSKINKTIYLAVGLKP